METLAAVAGNTSAMYRSISMGLGLWKVLWVWLYRVSGLGRITRIQSLGLRVLGLWVRSTSWIFAEARKFRLHVMVSGKGVRMI